MRKLLLSFLILWQAGIGYSQIDPHNGIYDIDSCHFESICPMVQFDSINQGIWQIGKPSKIYFDSAFSPVNAIVTDTLNNYPVSNHSYFDLAVPNWYGAGIIVSFRHKFDTDTLTDGGYIEVSYDDEGVWTNIINENIAHGPIGFNVENLYTSQDTLADGVPGFSGNSQGWVHTRVQWIWLYWLKNYPPDTLRLRFHFVSDSIQTNKDGWMIDNILVSYADQDSSVDEPVFSQNDIKIAPNPVGSFACINLSESSGDFLTVSIFNSWGQKVKRCRIISSREFRIDTSELTQGIYFVQIENGNEILGTSRFVKK